MLTLMFLALSGIIVGALLAFLMRKKSPPPAFVLVPLLFLCIFIFIIVIWMFLPEAVQLPEHIKK
jgi:hypothetical protein